MPQETRAEIERERDDLRDALEGILDRVTEALGVADIVEDDDEEGAEELDDE